MDAPHGQLGQDFGESGFDVFVQLLLLFIGLLSCGAAGWHW